MSLAANDILTIPDELANIPRWVVWNLVKKQDGTTAKIPFSARTLNAASSSNPKTWSTLAEPLEVWTSYAGLGFVFNGDGIFGIDLDGCLDASGAVSDWAQEILEHFSGTFSEVSPSGTGIKIFAYGKLAGSIKKSLGNHIGIEAYSTGRFFCVTGNMYGTAENVTDCQPGLDWLVEKYGVRTLESQGIRLIPTLRIYTGPRRSLDDMLGQMGIKAGRKIPFSNGDGYKRFVTCPFNPSHSNTDAYVYERSTGAMGFHCSHNSCSKHGWQDFRSAVGGTR